MANANPVSPKVKFASLWGAVAAIGSTALLGAANALTPDLFSVLGAYGPLIEGAVVLAITSLAGYLSRDSAREIGIAAQASSGAVVSVPDTSAPVAEVPSPIIAPTVDASGTTTFASSSSSTAPSDSGSITGV